MKLLLLACAGGAIGAGARYLANVAISSLLGASFPFATMFVNVLGSFLMGTVYVLVAERLGGSVEWRVFLAVGVLGGFTTFSAFSADVMNLMLQEGGLNPAVVVYVLGSVTFAIAAIYAGVSFMRAVLT